MVYITIMIIVIAYKFQNTNFDQTNNVCPLLLVGVDDYTGVPATLTFEPASQNDERCVTITIVNDEVTEMCDEMFRYDLSFESDRVNLPNGTVRIDDDDGKGKE